MLYTVLRYIYSGLMILAIPFILLRLYLRSRAAPDYRKRMLERFGFYSQSFQTGGIWLHAVSVGELMAARPLITKIMAQGNTPLTITTTTPTASMQVQKIYGDTVQHVYVPYDYPQAIARFLKKIKPKMTIIMETEIWPNIFYQLQKNQIPLVMANARLAKKSLDGYLKLKIFFMPIIRQVSCIAAQSKIDALHFEQLGALPKQLMIMGNIKYDVVVPEAMIQKAYALRTTFARPIWVAASTHPAEEDLIIQTAIKMKQQIPNVLCIIAPRHPERFDALADLCRAQQLNIARHSKQEKIEASTDILLADTLGELFFFYALSDVAIVCGSFAPIGGHNILEPAALGLPIIVGPQTFHFKTIMQDFLTDNAVLQIPAEDLSSTLSTLLSEHTKAKSMGERAKMLVANNQGAVDKLWHALESFI